MKLPLIGMAGASVMRLSALDALRSAIDLEFDAFEVQGEFPQCICDEVPEREREEGRALVESSGIALAVHAPFNSLNIAAMNPGIRAESVRQTLAAIDLCADMAGKIVIVHNGDYLLSESFRKRAPDAFQLQWDYNLESLGRAADRAGERGVTLCLENIGFERSVIDKCADDMLKIKEQVNSPALAFCLDIGHARLNNELPQAIEKMGPFTRHVHFTDNHGKRDDHLVIGEGNFDYAPHLDFFRKFEGIITLEVFKIGTDPKAALKSREHVKGLWGID